MAESTGKITGTINRISSITGKVPAYVDSTGLGDPILERLRNESRTFEGYVFTEASRNRLIDGLAAALQHSEVFLYNGSQHGLQLVNEMESMMIIRFRRQDQVSRARFGA